jgi:DNA processing protein
MNINTISPQDHEYTKLLDNIAKKPNSLYVMGVLPTKRIITVSIVGSRKPSSYGREVTEYFASNLAQKGIVIVSGLALGVDAIAHKACLDAKGTTIAVLPSGLGRIYPSTNRDLAHRIVSSGGALLSEYPQDAPPLKYQFLERNRLVSGLCDALLITEAAIRSGTLSTATHALEQGKEVFVVPGNITSPLSAGCNKLIKQGAHVATSFQDILEVIAPFEINKQSKLLLGDTPLENEIIKLIRSGIRDGDEIMTKSGAEYADFSSTLTIMELNEIIRPLGGNKWTLRS